MTGLWWWLILATGLGLTVGSFLNVVIYRLPRGLHVFRPTRSFCPHCESEIRWYDNLPLVSYALRGGRCRYCRRPISLQYPVVELLTALLFVMLLDALFVAQVRDGLSAPGGWLGDRIARHWPILLAHFILVAGLIAVTGTDIQAYWVDIRITGIIAISGMVLLTIWNPGRPAHPKAATWWRPGDVLAAACLTVALVRLLTWLVYDRWRDRIDVEAETQTDASAGPTAGAGPDDAADPTAKPATTPDQSPLPADSEAIAAEEETGSPKNSQAIPSSILAAVGWLMVALAVAVPLWVWLDRHAAGVTTGFILRAFGVLFAGFVTLLAASVVARETDDEIDQALDEERVTARSVATEELLRVLPAVLAGLGVTLLLTNSPSAKNAWLGLWAWSPTGTVQPVAGLSTAVAGFVLAGGFAWAMRIFFTLLLGKEALGFGDVHLLAAAGAVAGPVPAVLSFFAGSVIALAGMALLLPFKRRRVIPFGPWLALGVMTLVIAREPVVRYFRPALEALELLVRSPP